MAKNGDVSIFGSCVIRYSFNYEPSSVLNVGEYIHKISPLFVEPVSPDMMINENEVRADHNFIKRSICTLLNGTAWLRLKSNWSDWLIIDNLYFSYPLYLLESPSGQKRFLQFAPEIESEVFRIVAENEKYYGWSISKIDACPNYNLLINDLIKHLRKWNQSKIIIIDAVEAVWKVDDIGNITNFDYNPERMIMKSMATKLLLDRLDIVYFTSPSGSYSDYYNGCSFSNVHYGSEIYEYYSKLIYNKIVEDKNELIVQSKAVSTLQNQICGIINNVIISSSNTIGRLKKYYETNGSTTDSIDLLIQLSENIASNYGNHECEGWIGRIYRDGRGVDCDYIIASAWMRKAVGSGPKWIYWELFDILWRIDTPESISEALEIGMPLAESGVKELQGWVARCYREGKGVQKDLDKAAEWMRKARSRGLRWADWELFDILWRIDTPESLKEAISIAESLAQSGNRELQGRMGRAYRDGKGVEKNHDLAREWFQKAADQNLGWAKKELAELDNLQA